MIVMWEKAIFRNLGHGMKRKTTRPSAAIWRPKAVDKRLGKIYPNRLSRGGHGARRPGFRTGVEGNWLPCRWRISPNRRRSIQTALFGNCRSRFFAFQGCRGRRRRADRKFGETPSFSMASFPRRPNADFQGEQPGFHGLRRHSLYTISPGNARKRYEPR